MIHGKIRIWMLIYTIIFAIFSAFFVMNNIDNHYHVLYVIWSIAIYLLATAGNVFYTFNYSHDIIKKFWQIISPIIVLHFVAAGIIDSNFSLHKENIGYFSNIIIWITGIVFFYPTFRANFILGYKNNIHLK